jgi:asparagine synthase (glutamine-hydrolysing)
MSAMLQHRGPDDGGVWVDRQKRIALSHRRLAIQDLSSAGHQPMVSNNGRFVIAFNGEIYNHLDIRLELSNVTWRGTSDTETILAAIEAWGLNKALNKFVGMFSFAIWDSAAEELILARDRVGEKPLFYGWQGGVFLFGSELKALSAHSTWQANLDKNALTLYMRYGYVPLPHSIWQGIQKLLPGTALVLRLDNLIDGFLPKPNYYWRLLDENAKAEPINIDDASATDQLDQILRVAIQGQMVADVPLGAFLSGGVDSSTVVALMQAQSQRQVRTFSIGFSDAKYDEAIHAKAVAKHLGTAHTEHYVTPADAMEVIPRLPDMYDEPFADSSQIPTYLVAALARSEVTVTLSGDGGDELFGGYNRYFWGNAIWGKIGPVPLPFRQLAATLMTAPSPSTWDILGNNLPSSLRQKFLGDRIHKLSNIVKSKSSSELYKRLLSQQQDPENTVIGGVELPIWAEQESDAFFKQYQQVSFTEQMMFQDQIGYLTDDILTKVDRAAMSVGLETRIPMLDHRVIRFSMSMPQHMKIRNGHGKWLLRQVLYRYLPKELIERPKQGFGVPLGEWLRGPLRDWAEALLDESRLHSEGHLVVGQVRSRWKEHILGIRNWQYWLWNVLMFQAWHERWLGRRGSNSEIL